MNFKPTDAIPGSAKKIAVMRERATYMQPIFHRDDKRDMTDAVDVPVTSQQRKEKRSAYEPRRSKVVSSGRKMRAE